MTIIWASATIHTIHLNNWSLHAAFAIYIAETDAHTEFTGSSSQLMDSHSQLGVALENKNKTNKQFSCADRLGVAKAEASLKNIEKMQQEATGRI